MKKDFRCQQEEIDRLIIRLMFLTNKIAKLETDVHLKMALTTTIFISVASTRLMQAKQVRKTANIHHIIINPHKLAIPDKKFKIGSFQ